MLVDLARNDVGKVSEFGSVKVHDLHHVKRFSHVMHLTCLLYTSYGTPVMVNDPSVTQTGLAAAAAIFGRDKVITEEPRMGGEDFAKYDAPKAMLCLGGGRLSLIHI